MASSVSILLHAVQAAFSAYNLYLATISITKLREYEEKSKKAAEWSNIAAHQLHKTRTTQASGTAAVLLSFISALSTIFYSRSAYTGIAAAVINIGALVAARSHVGDFWKGKTKIPLPGVGDYNDAISITQEIRMNSAYLATSWVATGILALFSK